MLEITNKITIHVHEIKNTYDSHIKLKMEINGKVCTLLIY